MPDRYTLPRSVSGTPPAATDLVMLVPPEDDAEPKARTLQEVGSTFATPQGWCYSTTLLGSFGDRIQILGERGIPAGRSQPEWGNYSSWSEGGDLGGVHRHKRSV